MVTIYRTEKDSTLGGKYNIAELRGLSTDEKPTEELDDKEILNGAVFVEIDTQKLYFYDADEEEWLSNESGE